jgi:hypothetical protein
MGCSAALNHWLWDEMTLEFDDNLLNLWLCKLLYLSS